MVDRNLENFYGRLGRIDRIHQAGGGFEAAGAIGMSHFRTKRRSRRLGLLAPLVLIMMTVVVIKAGVHVSIGDELYQERIVALRNGDQAEKIGAYVLQADPLTLMLAEQFRKLTR
jgi:hypothetical protein